MSQLEASIAANRFGLGARPGELGEIAGDPRGWLKAQLAPGLPWPKPVAGMPPTGARMVEFPFIRSEENKRMVQRRLEMAARGREFAAMEGSGPMAARFMVYPNSVKQRFDVAVASETPFRERLVHFWANHFVVSAAKPTARAMPGTFERDVARKHVDGRFHDMLVASSQHPAMQFYLDNFTSIGPNSKWGQNPDLVPFVSAVHGRPDGLNENLAREILELHTVGVDGGYSQADVRNFAYVISGWGYDLKRREKPNAPPFATLSDSEIFHFNPDAHEPGPQTIMSRTYPDTGLQQGLDVLADLAAKPQTARFIATKLARHFIADDPPQAAVERIAQAFLDSDGDLPTVHAALVDSPEAWTPGHAKAKRPEEFLISAVRAMDGPEIEPRALLTLLQQMGQPTYAPGGPDGWPDTAEFWTGADALWKRLEWSNLAADQMASVKLDPLALARNVIGPRLSDTTATEIARAESPAQGLTLFLISPDFLMR